MKRALIALAACALAMHAATPADSARGADDFQKEGCNQCHAINGIGGKVGPDLGKLVDRGFTPASLAGTMWNHAPAMWSEMQQRNVQPVALDEQAAADLYAFFYSKRFFENPGDAGRGKTVFESRSCSICHGLTDSKIPAAKPVSQWTELTDPIAMIEKMWDHASNMRDEMSRRKVRWPRLSGQDVADLMLYLRNLPSTPKNPGIFQTTAGSNGEVLFRAKGCSGCHDQASQFISKSLAGQTLTDIAAGMWNHGLLMPPELAKFQAGEMREIVSYVWSQRLLSSVGSFTRGKRIFAAKNCSSCHDDPSSGAPALTPGSSFSGVSMVAALWRHGPAMLNQMQQKHLAWPRFESGEMADLIAYVATRQSRNAPSSR